jgi:hypothetical protein
LSAAQKECLKELLLVGAMAQGFASDSWTCPRVAQVIEQQFAVTYHPDDVWRLLGTGLHLPETGAACPRTGRSRDYHLATQEVATDQKKAKRQQAVVAFLDCPRNLKHLTERLMEHVTASGACRFA